MFYLFAFGVLVVLNMRGGIRKVTGKTSTEEVRTGKCIPLYDKVSGILDFLSALGYMALGIGSFCKWTLNVPVPAWILWLLFLLPLLIIMGALIARTVLQEDHFY